MGVKRTWSEPAAMSAYDPKATSARLFCCGAVHSSRSKIVLNLQEGGSRLGSKSHEAAGIHHVFRQQCSCMAADRVSAAAGARAAYWRADELG